MLDVNMETPVNLQVSNSTTANLHQKTLHENALLGNKKKLRLTDQLRNVNLKHLLPEG